jgi:hypothetical protein
MCIAETVTVLDAHLFTSFSEVREIVHEWMTACNDERPMEPLRQHASEHLQPAEGTNQNRTNARPGLYL